MSKINTAFTVEELPPPPSDKTGWPWTQGNQPLPEQMPNGSQWPRISIVTPSYNYGEFIEETIRSVLLQGYPNLEYIIIDGGSTDNTVEVIKKYQKYITYWVSEADGGQTDAINKGYQHCTGELFVWLNADDLYAKPTCLQEVIDLYLQGYKFIAGGCIDTYEAGEEQVYYSTPTSFKRYLKFWISICNYTQPSVFVAKEIADRCFPLQSNLYILMDYQFFLRVLSQNPASIYVDSLWTRCKKHGKNKTLIDYPQWFEEFREVVTNESKILPLIERKILLVELEDYAVIKSLSKNATSLTPQQLILALGSRFTLFRWPIFWKLLLKSVVGKKVYSQMKKIT